MPIVYQISTDDWDFFITVAGVFMAMTRLNQLNLAEAHADRVGEIVTSKVSEWNANGIAAFEDCKSMFERTYAELASLEEYRRDPRFLGSDSIGCWITWNLLDRRPAAVDEQKLMRLLGVTVTHGFFDWWGPA